MNGKRLLRSWMVSVFGLLMLAAGALQAQDTPIKLYLAKVDVNGTVRLAWTRPANVMVESYQVYRAKGLEMGNAMMIMETKDTAMTDMLPPTFDMLSSYTYMIVGKTAMGGSVKSNIVVVSNFGIPSVGSFRLEAKADEANVVHLTWGKPPVDTVTMYYLYRFGGPYSAIQLIDSTTGLALTDTPPVPPLDPMMGRMGDQQMMYTYFVKAETPNGKFQSTNAAVYLPVLMKRDQITFLTTPVTSAQTGVEYAAKVLATSSKGAKITYILDRKPEGMTLDLSGATPVIRWTPQQRGFYDVRVIARSDSGGEARQEYAVNVAGGNGIVWGKVTNAQMNASDPVVPIAKVIIQIMKRDSSRQLCFAYATVTDANGEFRFTKLDPGSYILQAIPTSGEYQGQWYDGKSNPDEATRVPVSDSSTATPFSPVNFRLLSRTAPASLITVTGSVADTNGLPVNVKGTRVTFVRSDFALNSSTPAADLMIDNFKKFFDYDRMTDFRIEGTSKFAVSVPVDSLGNYKVKLPKGSYIALARAPGYAAEFYQEQTDLLAAAVLVLNADTTGISFTLAALPPVALGEMSGTVRDTAKNIGVRARVIAFRDGWTTADGYRIAKNYFTDTDSLGNYQFTDLLPGSYIVMAVPMGGYAPAYYSTGDSVLAWKRATKVVINGNSVSGIDIIVRQLSAEKSGFTWIGGGVKDGRKAGVAGAIVAAFNASGAVAGYGITDASGNYKILGLAPDRYTVMVEKAGYTSTTSAVASPTYTMDPSAKTNTVGATVSFTIESATSVQAQPSSVVPASFTVGQNYPNPFNPSTKFQFSIPAAQHVTVSVYDLLGREVASLVNGQMSAGTYTVEWNASAMSTGIYFYRVQAGATSVVKKMMLLK